MIRNLRPVAFVRLAAILVAACLVGCEAPAPKRISTWSDYRLGYVVYDSDKDNLNVTVERGSFAESLHVRRISVSSGLAVDPIYVSAPKMWPHARLTVHGAASLQSPGWVSFELFEWPEKVWQNVRIEISPPPEFTVSDGVRTVTPNRRYP